MQVSVETKSALERQMTITIPADRIDNDVVKQVQQTARTVRIDGFRPGKVPLKVVQKRYGAGIRQDVVGEILQQSFYEAVQQEKLIPAGGPSIEMKTDEAGKDVEFIATFEVYPEIDLADFSDVEIAKETSEISAADVDQMVETLRKQQTEWSEVKRAAKDGDKVVLDFEGFIGDEAFEGGKGEGVDLILGSNSMIPGFEDAVIGKKIAKEFDIKVTFPDDYQAENLKGKEAVFKATAKTISEPTLPELNEEFFKKFGMDSADLESFKTDVEKNMSREMSQSLKGKLKDQVFAKLVELNAIAVPTALVDGEIDNLRKQAVQQYGGQGANLDFNMLPKEMFTDQAKRRVSVGLLVQEVIKSNEIKADDERVRSTIEEMAQTYQDPKEVVDHYYSNDDMLNQVKSLVIEDQVIDHLLSSAKVNETAVSYEEAIKPAAQPQAEDEANEE
ncbi:MAG: trigger factor [Pseudomonadales bacterium]|nr:trigger factor [Pseudomonadales bacterium]NRA16137.1 trigger factor [Oceanospirillaceae bacterium]